MSKTEEAALALEEAAAKVELLPRAVWPVTPDTLRECARAIRFKVREAQLLLEVDPT